MRITIWNEFRHERQSSEIAQIYPNGIHGAIAAGLADQTDFEITTATLDEPEHGLTEAVLAETDVLVWWGHIAHRDVEEEIVERVHDRIMQGMGLVVLHSGHLSKIFIKLMGTTCWLKWREADERERVWVVNPAHPIAAGLGEYFEIPQAEMYGEHFDIPAPDELVFVSWFQGGEVFRSGCVFHRGAGKIFYFRPGHETLPIFHNETVLHVIGNGIRYVGASGGTVPTYGNAMPVEELAWYKGPDFSDHPPEVVLRGRA